MRLIDTRKRIDFKNWVEQHNPHLDWDWSDPEKLAKQFCDNVKVCGDIDLKTIFICMFAQNDSRLPINTTKKFLKEKY